MVTFNYSDIGVFEVLTTHINTHIGGEDFDHKVIYYFVKYIKEKLNKDEKAFGKLQQVCEWAKRSIRFVKVELVNLFKADEVNKLLLVYPGGLAVKIAEEKKGVIYGS